jgi:hypothetical protein
MSTPPSRSGWLPGWWCWTPTTGSCCCATTTPHPTDRTGRRLAAAWKQARTPTAALRELTEETGWVDIRLLGEIGSGEVTMEYDDRLVRQRERLYLARTDVARRPLVDVAAMHTTDRIAAWRWWTLGELRTTTEVVWPAGLADLIDRAGG